ncbi:hypothetical protein ACIOD2_34370 [Amycolatopsis sp. NPDC088138]|uniref:hypothetical protein n=1 Tax=Amycolatopsis sp. NPDC088138 TaxID=3363938 RepID=UPI0037F9742E
MTGNRLRRRSAATAVTALGVLALAAPPAQAAETTVPCDPAALVSAVGAASASTEADTLTLTPDCVYTLTAVADTLWDAGLPAVKGKLTVHGNHATIRRAPDAPQFRLIANDGDLTLTDLTLTGGHAPDGTGVDTYGDGTSGEAGGAIQSWGPLTITGSVLTGNTSGAGAPGPAGTATVRAGRGGGGGFGGAISSYGFSVVPLTITGSTITGNATGPGGVGGDGAGTASGGRGGTGGFGGGVEVIRGTKLAITDSSISGNTTGDGGRGGRGPGGGGSGDGGGGGVGAGLFASVGQGAPLLYPVVTGTKITGNHAGRGGDAGTPGTGGYLGWAGYGGSGGGLSVFDDVLTLDGSSVSDNSAGEPGAGSFPSPATGGGIHTLDSQVTLVGGAEVTGNHPDNCYEVADVPGCVNNTTRRTPTTPTRGQDAELIAAAKHAAATR